MAKVIIFVLSISLQPSEEAFCALAKSEFPQIAPPLDFRTKSTKAAMKFRNFYSKQKQNVRNFDTSLEDDLSTRSVHEISITIPPENRSKNKTKKRKLHGRNKMKIPSKPAENSLRNNSKKYIPSRRSKNTRYATAMSFLYRRQGTRDHMKFTVDRMTLPPGFPTLPRFTVGDKVTPALFQHCNVTRDHCMVSYETGIFCARTVYYNYNTFDNLCVMDYVNCMEGFDFWQAIHPGPCIKIEPYSEYMHYPYQDDYFIDRDFIIEDIF